MSFAFSVWLRACVFLAALSRPFLARGFLFLTSDSLVRSVRQLDEDEWRVGDFPEKFGPFEGHCFIEADGRQNCQLDQTRSQSSTFHFTLSTSNESHATSNDSHATSNDSRATSNDSRAPSNDSLATLQLPTIPMLSSLLVFFPRPLSALPLFSAPTLFSHALGRCPCLIFLFFEPDARRAALSMWSPSSRCCLLGGCSGR